MGVRPIVRLLNISAWLCPPDHAWKACAIETWAQASLRYARSDHRHFAQAAARSHEQLFDPDALRLIQPSANPKPSEPHRRSRRRARPNRHSVRPHIAAPPPVHARLRRTPRRSRRRRCTPGDGWRAMERRPKPCTHPSVAADLSAPVRDQSGRETGQRLPGTRRRLSAAERVQSGRSAAMRAGWGIPSESGPRCVAIPSGGADESGGLSAPPE